MKSPIILLASALLLAAPAMAQQAPPAGMAAGPEARGKVRDSAPRRVGPAHQNPFGDVSPQGRKIIHEAMRTTHDPAGRAALKAARDQVKTLLSAERLDSAALARAMETERKLVESQHANRQQAMIGAFQKMTPADRKAFAEASEAGRLRMDAMVKKFREPKQPKP